MSHNLIEASAPAVTNNFSPDGESIVIARHTPRPLCPRRIAKGSSTNRSSARSKSSLLPLQILPRDVNGGAFHNLTVQSSPAVTTRVFFDKDVTCKSQTRDECPYSVTTPPKFLLIPGVVPFESKSLLWRDGTRHMRAVRSSDVEKTWPPSDAQRTLNILPSCPLKAAQGFGRSFAKQTRSTCIPIFLASLGAHNWISLKIVPPATFKSSIEEPYSASE